MLPLSAIKNLKKENNQPKKPLIDLNCDLGNSYGVYQNEPNTEILKYISSVNIACGAHAGDPISIINAIKAAKDNNLAVGAHIGYPDIQGFGFRAMQLTDEEIQGMVIHQIGGLFALAKSYNVNIEFVRPHGALYQQAAKDINVSLSIAKAIVKFDPWLIYVGAAGKNLIEAGEHAKVRIAQEVYLNKKYKADGSIDYDSAEVNDITYSLNQLDSLIKSSEVITNEGTKVKVDFKTIHVCSRQMDSLTIAQKACEYIEKPVPVGYSLVGSTGWV